MDNFSFNEFNETIISYFYLNDEIAIPLKIDIADINFNADNTKFLKAKKENNNFIINKNKNPFQDNYDYLIFKNEIKKYLKFLDFNSKLFENNTLTLLEYFNLKNIDELLDYFIKYLEVPISKFLDLKNEIELYKEILMGNFMERLKEYMQYNEDLPEFKPDLKGVSADKFDLKTSQTYIKAQSIIEYHNATVFFPENLGKSYSEWSWREIQVRLMFLGRKNQVDSENNRLQNAVSDRIMNDGKGK